MPSPPLVPDHGPIDTGHLDRMTLGDSGLEREVLAMFSAQADRVIGALGTLPADAMAAQTHTLKGSAQAIGACRVVDAAEWLETRLRNGDDPSEALSGLRAAVAEARMAIDAILRRS